MGATPHQWHNALTRDFVNSVVGQTQSTAELMVVLESCILAAMLGMHRIYGTQPHVTVELVESAIHRATERFSEKVQKHG